jgi:hypothetical protein
MICRAVALVKYSNEYLTREERAAHYGRERADRERAMATRLAEVGDAARDSSRE